MPLVAWTVLVFTAGLLVTFHGAPASSAALAALALAGSVVFARGRGAIAGLCAVLAGGVLVATATMQHDRACGTSIGTMRAWRAESDVDLRPGAAARLALSAAGCRATALVLVDAGRTAAGSSVEVRGTISHGARGLVVRDASVRRIGNANRLTSLRAAAGRRIDRIFGTDAPMARALVIGDMSGIPTSERDAFASAGLVHMLSVSGLHVGIIALALELLAQLLRAPRTPARVASVALLALYVASIGAPPPAVRAAIMLGALLLSRAAQRPVSPWAVLALGAGAPLVDPRVAIDLGWQLSVAGTAALVAGGRLAQRIVPSEWQGWRGTLAAGAVVSVVATAVTAPLVAWTFGRIALLGPATNLVADPVMALLQPVLFLALAIPVAPVEALGAGAAHLLLAAFARIAHVAASIPGAAPAVSPTVLGAWAAGAASMAVLVACCAERPARAVLAASAALAVIVLEPLVPVAAVPEIHMLDVGQGDALALRTSRGRWIVVDAGRTWEGGDAGRSVVAPYLARRGGEVALFILSHPHADHAGGAASLFALRPPARVLDPGYAGTTSSYRDALVEARRLRIPWQRVHPGDSLLVDDVVLTALAPDSAWAAGLHDANLASTVVMARVGGVRVLFTGDAEAAEEDWLVDRYGESGALRADVLKVAHHGSRTSTTPRFLAAVRPRLALVSVGAHNAYGHPDADVLDALAVAGVPVVRTDRLGTVVVRAVGPHVEVSARGARWSIPDR